MYLLYVNYLNQSFYVVRAGDAASLMDGDDFYGRFQTKAIAEDAGAIWTLSTEDCGEDVYGNTLLD